MVEGAEPKTEPKIAKVEVDSISTAQLLDLMIHDLETLSARQTELERRMNVIYDEIMRELHEVAADSEEDDDEGGPSERLTPAYS